MSTTKIPADQFAAYRYVDNPESAIVLVGVYPTLASAVDALPLVDGSPRGAAPRAGAAGPRRRGLVLLRS